MKILVFFICIFSTLTSLPTMACPLATLPHEAGFCPTFRTAAQCHCTASGLPARMCTDMNIIYERMLALFRSVQKACEYQHDTSTQNCIDSWHCFRDGGLTSRGELCNVTGASCV